MATGRIQVIEINKWKVVIDLREKETSKRIRKTRIVNGTKKEALKIMKELLAKIVAEEK
jgi:hypothetical protein